MSDLFHRILDVIAREQVLISDHGYDELAADGILVRDILEGVTEGAVVEELLQGAVCTGAAKGQ